MPVQCSCAEPRGRAIAAEWCTVTFQASAHWGREWSLSSGLTLGISASATAARAHVRASRSSMCVVL